MYTLTLLDYTAELIELTYELGAFTRNRILPAIIASYVVATMAVDYITGLRGPTRPQMIQKLTQEWRSIIKMDPQSKPEETLEFTWFLESLSDEELKAEFLAI